MKKAFRGTPCGGTTACARMAYTQSIGLRVTARRDLSIHPSTRRLMKHESPAAALGQGQGGERERDLGLGDTHIRGLRGDKIISGTSPYRGN